MSPRDELAERLTSALEAELGGADHLGATVERLLGEALARYPDLARNDETFFRLVANVLNASKDPLRTLSELQAPTLYLAAACLAGDPRGVEHFQGEYYPLIRRAVRRIRLVGAGEEDVQQSIFERVFLGTEDTPPLIVSYSGTSSFVAWLRVVSVRFALNQARHHRREQPSQGAAAVADRIEAEEGDLRVLHHLYGPAYQSAFQAALASLSQRDRELLRYRVVDALSVSQIASLYGVHRVTVARWLAKAREQLASRTHEHLSIHLGGSAKEAESLVRALYSQVDVSVRRLLSQPSAKPEGGEGPAPMSPRRPGTVGDGSALT